MKKSTVQFAMRLPLEMSNELDTIAAQKRINKSELIRRYIAMGMTETGYENAESQFLNNVRQALREILDPAVNRIAAISVKGGVTSAAAYFLSATALAAFVHPDIRADFEDAIVNAKKMGVQYMKIQDNSIGEFLDTGVEKLNKKYLEED